MPRSIEIPHVLTESLSEPEIVDVLRQTLRKKIIKDTDVVRVLHSNTLRDRFLHKLEILERQQLSEATRMKLDALLQLLQPGEETMPLKIKRSIGKRQKDKLKRRRSHRLLFFSIATLFGTLGGMRAKHEWNSMSDEEKLAIADRIIELNVPFVSPYVRGLRDRAVRKKQQEVAAIMQEKITEAGAKANDLLREIGFGKHLPTRKKKMKI